MYLIELQSSGCRIEIINGDAKGRSEGRNIEDREKRKGIFI